jgi:hypothetical protein
MESIDLLGARKVRPSSPRNYPYSVGGGLIFHAFGKCPKSRCPRSETFKRNLDLKRTRVSLVRTWPTLHLQPPAPSLAPRCRLLVQQCIQYSCTKYCTQPRKSSCIVVVSTQLATLVVVRSLGARGTVSQAGRQWSNCHGALVERRDSRIP